MGDSILRGELAKPNGSELIGMKNGEKLSTVLANRWANSGADKKEILLDLPLLFPDYDAIIKKNPTWKFLYPGSFCIGDDEKIYIAYGPSDNTSTKRFVAVYSIKGSYKGYFQTNNGGAGVNGSAVSEGIVVTTYYGGLKLFLGGYDGSLFEYDITSVTYGSKLKNAASYQVGLYNQFSFLNGVWVVEQAAPSNGQIRQRNIIAYFNSSFSLTGFIEFDPFDAGYITHATTEYGPVFTKRQGLCLAPGVLLGAFGGVFIPGKSTESPSNYQGIKAFATDGTKIVEALHYPSRFISKLSSTGKNVTRIENEGICYNKGSVFTLWIYTDRHESLSKTSGILITKEFSMTPDLDLSATTVIAPGYSSGRMANGVYPRLLSGDTLVNPVTGKIMPSMNEVLDFMRLAGQKTVMIYTSSTPLKDLNGVALPENTAVRLESYNNLTFKATFTSSLNKREQWITFSEANYLVSLPIAVGTSRVQLDGAISDTVKKGRLISNVIGGNPELDSDQILVLDQQSNSSNGLNPLIIGGGSSLYRSASTISFATNPVGVAPGGTIRWRIDETSLLPYADDTYSVGNPTNRLSVIYATAGTINTSDGTKKTSPLPITDLVLDAWEGVQFISYQWLESIRIKGEDMARWHFGVIAQQVRDVFIAHGLDGTRYGLLCFDEWDDEFESVIAIRKNPKTDEQEEYETGEIKLVRKAGSRWGIRPDQCLFLEAALQRRNYSRILKRIKALEDASQG